MGPLAMSLFASMFFMVLALLAISIWARGPAGKPLGSVACTAFGVAYTGGTMSYVYAIRYHDYAFAPAAFGVIRSFALHADGATSGAAPHLFAAAALAQGLAIVAFAAGRRR